MRSVQYLFLGFCLITFFATAAEKVQINWQQPVNLSLDGQGIGEAVTQLLKQTGVRVVPMRDLNASGVDIWHSKYYLQGRRMPLKQAVSWIARLCGGYYYITGDRVIVATGYSWIDKRSFAPIFPNVETLVGRERDIDAFEKFVMELTRVLTLLDAGYFVRLEQKGEEVKLVANFPKSLLPLMNKALSSLETAGKIPQKSPPQVISAAQRDLIARLYKPVLAAYRNRSLWEIVNDLSRQSGVNIGFDQPCSETPVTLDLGRVSLRKALQALCKAAGFRGVATSEPNGLWLSRMPANWSPMRNNSTLWTNTAEVVCYDLNAIGLAQEGAAVAAQVLRKVEPASWQDPLACALFHKPSGKLLVINRRDVIPLVENFLAGHKTVPKKTYP